MERERKEFYGSNLLFTIEPPLFLLSPEEEEEEEEACDRRVGGGEEGLVAFSRRSLGLLSSSGCN